MPFCADARSFMFETIDHEGLPLNSVNDKTRTKYSYEEYSSDQPHRLLTNSRQLDLVGKVDLTVRT